MSVSTRMVVVPMTSSLHRACTFVYKPLKLMLGTEGDAYWCRTAWLGVGPEGIEPSTFCPAGITRGCDPLDAAFFCPLRPLTRAEMASFIVRAMGL